MQTLILRYLLGLFLGCVLGLSPQALLAQTTTNSLAAEEDATNGWSRDKVSQMSQQAAIEEQKSRQAESEANAQRLGVPLAALQQQTRKWIELKTLLNELIIEVEKRSHLNDDLDNIRKLQESFAKEGWSQKPPYTISDYDRLMAEQDALRQNAKTTELALNTAKQNIAQTLDRLEETRKHSRQLIEQLGKESSPAAEWRTRGAQLDTQLAEARFELEKSSEKNLRLEQQVTDQRNRLLQDQASWVKARIEYRTEDIQSHEQALAEKRKELQKNLALLLNKKRDADQNWIQAQTEGQKSAKTPAGTNGQNALKGLDRWRKTYQTAIDQTTDMLRLLDQQAVAWQRRFSLLKGPIERDTLISWNKESLQKLDALERQLFLEQQRQNDVWRQINTAESIAGNNSNLSGSEADRTEIKALQQMAAFGMDYITAISTTQNLERRLKDDIEDHLDQIPISYQIGRIWAQAKAVWNYELWVIDDRPLTVKKILVALVILIAGIVITKVLIRRLAEKILHRPQVKPTTAAAIEKLLLYTSYLLVVLFALRMVNIPLTAFAFFGGAIAIGLGFGAQNLINNFISGFIIMGEQPISIGDLIEVDGLLGEVEEVGARCTRIRTGENIHILVPNSSFLEKNITNWTHSDRRIRAHINLGVMYGSPVAQVQRLLLQVCSEFTEIHSKPEPIVLFTDFGDNALIFEVHFWITVQRVIQRRMIESSLRFRIDETFRQAGIVIAFPQRDVHLDTVKPLHVKLLPTD
jgi:potassium efflux system protein